MSKINPDELYRPLTKQISVNSENVFKYADLALAITIRTAIMDSIGADEKLTLSEAYQVLNNETHAMREFIYRNEIKTKEATK